MQGARRSRTPTKAARRPPGEVQLCAPSRDPVAGTAGAWVGQGPAPTRQPPHPVRPSPRSSRTLVREAAPARRRARADPDDRAGRPRQSGPGERSQPGARGHRAVGRTVARRGCPRRDLAMPLVSLNHGIRKAYPRILIERKTATDAALLADALDKLVPLGLRVRADEARDSGRSTARCPYIVIGGAGVYRHTLYEGDDHDHDSLVDAVGLTPGIGASGGGSGTRAGPDSSRRRPGCSSTRTSRSRWCSGSSCDAGRARAPPST